LEAAIVKIRKNWRNCEPNKYSPEYLHGTQNVALVTAWAAEDASSESCKKRVMVVRLRQTVAANGQPENNVVKGIVGRYGQQVDPAKT